MIIPHSTRPKLICDLYITGETVVPDTVSNILGVRGGGFEKGDAGMAGGKQVLRSYGTWRLPYSEISIREDAQGVFDDAVDFIIDNIQKLSTICELVNTKFRIRLSRDMLNSEDIFNVEIDSHRVVRISSVVSHIDVIAL